MHLPKLTLDKEEMEEEEFSIARGEDWKVARAITRKENLEWAIGSFHPFKAAGTDGIFPALLQKGKRWLVGPLERVFRACLAHGYVPECWRTTRVVFLPKHGKAHHEKAKDFRPVSLTSFVLKLLERLVDRYIRDTSLKERPLHTGQHAYMAGRSVDSALREVVTSIKKGMRRRGMVLGAFVDIEGAFSYATVEGIRRAESRHAVPATLRRWTGRSLRNRRIVAEWKKETVERYLNEGCPQGGVASPLYWSLVVDELVIRLN